MINQQLSSLFQPIAIGDMRLKNRIVMAPMGTGLTSDDGSVTQQLIEYHAERARGGVGLIVVEPVCVDYPTGALLPKGLRLDGERYITGLGKLARAVKAAGANVSLQLGHGGRYSRSQFTGGQPVAPSPIPSRYTKEMPRELTTGEVEAIIEKFAQAAKIAQEAGFDGVELMGSTGYLISQFLSSVTNKRSDRFGGDTRSRATFVVEIIESIRRKVGASFPVCLKFSVDDYLPEGNTIEDSQIVARRAEAAGVSMLHAWAGWHESPIAMLPMSVARGAFVPLAQAVKAVAQVPVIAVGRINDALLAAQIVAEGKADLVAMGRALLADPHLPAKAAQGNLDDIRMCIACCRCFDDVTPSRSKGQSEPAIVCSLNAELGREWQRRTVPAKRAKNVLVVGGGPAGMEAARVSAARGHRVTLWEEQNRLGGTLSLASTPPHKEEINNIARYLGHQMQKLGVKLEMGKKVTAQAVSDGNFDEVIVAAGALPLIPAAPGAQSVRAVTANDVLAGETVGERVVVIGGGMVGSETAEFLASKGKKVTIVEMLDKIALDLGPTTRWVTVKRIRESDIEILTGTRFVEFADSGVVVQKEGLNQVLEADTVVMATGMRANTELADALKGKVRNLHVIGDCLEPRRILEAIHEGWEVGCTI